MAEPEDTPDGLVPAPRTNPDLVGQEDAEAEFLQAYETGKLPHAWIVGGPRGIGKATLAFRIARFVLAAGNNNGPDLFGGAGAAPASLRIESDHPVFRRVLSGGHADLLTVERGVDEQRNRRRDEITVGEARQVSSFLTKTPAEGGWRVVIVDEAEAMNHNAANAILKTLEEPAAPNPAPAGVPQSGAHAADHSFALPSIAIAAARRCGVGNASRTICAGNWRA